MTTQRKEPFHPIGLIGISKFPRARGAAEQVWNWQPAFGNESQKA